MQPSYISRLNENLLVYDHDFSYMSNPVTIQPVAITTAALMSPSLWVGLPLIVIHYSIVRSFCIYKCYQNFKRTMMQGFYLFRLSKCVFNMSAFSKLHAPRKLSTIISPAHLYHSYMYTVTGQCVLLHGVRLSLLLALKIWGCPHIF